MMDSYAEQIRNHWRRRCPRRYAQIDDPDAFFAREAAAVARGVAELSERLLEPEPAHETYIERVRRLTRARRRAERIVMAARLPEAEGGTGAG